MCEQLHGVRSSAIQLVFIGDETLVVLSAQSGHDHAQELLPSLLDVRTETRGAELHGSAHGDTISEKLQSKRSIKWLFFFGDE